MRKQLRDWVAVNREFYNDSLEVMYNNMKSAVQAFVASLSEERRMRMMNNLPPVNYLPQYGGLLGEPTNAIVDEIRYLADNNVTQFLTGAVWSMPQERNCMKK